MSRAPNRNVRLALALAGAAALVYLGYLALRLMERGT